MHHIVVQEKMNLKNDWLIHLKSEIHQPYFLELMDFIHEEYQNEKVYPQYDHIFKALELTSYQDSRVLILGQDPYHQPGQAMGLAFSVPSHMVLPPSLKNIFKELKNDLSIDNTCGDLSSWAKQGVLLINSIWTVRDSQPLSHKDHGWEILTDRIIALLNEKSQPVIFVLWGAYARSKKSLITNKRHLIIENVHPSPLSAYRGFFGSKVFSQINHFLIKNQFQPINFSTRSTT